MTTCDRCDHVFDAEQDEEICPACDAELRKRVPLRTDEGTCDRCKLPFTVGELEEIMAPADPITDEAGTVVRFKRCCAGCVAEQLDVASVFRTVSRETDRAIEKAILGPVLTGAGGVTQEHAVEAFKAMRAPSMPKPR